MAWQVQPSLPTVQGTLASALYQLTGETVLPQGSGRTDTGVHALRQVASFSLAAPIPPANLLRALNRKLPPSIRILAAEPAPPAFHARHSAVSKTYEYRIFAAAPRRHANTPTASAHPFLPLSSGTGPWPFDLNRAREAAAHILGEHDFTSFAAVDPELDRRASDSRDEEVKGFDSTIIRSSTRRIFCSEWSREDDLCLYRVTGSGFLHHMVRNLVGTFVEAAAGRIATDAIRRILALRSRSAAGPTAPARGLFLVNVEYPLHAGGCGMTSTRTTPRSAPHHAACEHASGASRLPLAAPSPAAASALAARDARYPRRRLSESPSALPGSANASMPSVSPTCKWMPRAMPWQNFPPADPQLSSRSCSCPRTLTPSFRRVRTPLQPRTVLASWRPAHATTPRALPGCSPSSQRSGTPESHPPIPILFAANVGEEGEGDLRGMRHLFASGSYSGRIAAALALEGSGNATAVTRALGSRRFRVTISGPGGHSWTDASTPNPITLLSRGICHLADSVGEAASPEGRTTFSPGQITGGTSINSIPESATVLLDLRSTEPDQLDLDTNKIRQTFTSLVAQANQQNPERSIQLGLTVIGDRPAAVLPEDSVLLDTLRAVDRHLGLRTEFRLGSTDANLPLSLGLPAAALAAGGIGGGIHTLAEWYDPTGRETALRRVLLTLLDLAQTLAA